MLFLPKNCYKASSYFYSAVCFAVTSILLVLADISGLFQQQILYSIPLIGVSLFCSICGIVQGIKTYQFRKCCFTIKSNGKQFQGIVKNYHCRKAMVDEKSSDAYSFLITYFNPEENKQKEFWTPVVNFCPFNTKNISCVVYEYNGKAYAEDFKGWENSGAVNIASEISSWLPIIIGFAILIILYFIENNA